MYYCPHCKKKFRQYRRRCPICNGPCYRKDNRALLLIVTVGVLFLLLVGLIILLGSTANKLENETVNSSVLSSSQSAPVSSDPASSAPSSNPESTGTTPPSSAPPATTAPSVNGNGMYTLAELEALDKTYNEGGFGAGRSNYPNRPSNPVNEQKKYGQYGAYFIGEDTDTVYLTFDCGYEYYATDANGQKYAVTGKILDVLKEKDVKAVFFVTMDYVKMEPALVQRMIDEGHTVGNHSNKHPVMPAQTIERMEYEVMSLHDYMLENYGYKMTLFRPPTGAYSVQSLAVLQNLGYKSVLWSFQYLDYDTENQWTEANAFERITGSAHNGAIYLLHAISETNAKVLDDVIDHLRNEKNYKIELFS